MPTSLRATVNLMPKVHPRRVAELAVEAERLGYTRCWVYDEGLTARDVYVTLTAVASRTQRMLVGPGITNPFSRHPGTTAAALASLDEVSGGRAFLGLGAGGGLTLAPMAIERRRPITAVREMVGALRRLFAGETADVDGDTVTFRHARLSYGRADTEIWLAGRGPRMLALAGEVADGFNLSYLHKETIGDAVAAVRAGAAGRDTEPALSYSTMVCTTDQHLQDARSHLTFRLVDSPPEVKQRLGLGDAQVDELRAALAAEGPAGAAHLVREEWVLPFVIAGTPAECASELATLMATHGIDDFQLPVQELESAEELMTTVAGIVAAGPG